ncbi:MAG: hypothetical protein ACKPE6_01055 [Gammaproteobacteria bacterium]
MTGWSAAEFRIDTSADGSTRLTDINLADGDDGVFVFRSIEWVYFSDTSVQLGVEGAGLGSPGALYYDADGTSSAVSAVPWALSFGAIASSRGDFPIVV